MYVSHFSFVVKEIEQMTENEKIELVIEEYKEYLNNSNSDIFDRECL